MSAIESTKSTIDGNNQLHKCEHCQRIILNKPIENVQYAQYDVIVPHSRGEAFAASEAGCPLFALYPKLPFYGLGILESITPQSWVPWFSPKNFLKFPGWQRRHLWKLGQSMLNPFDKPYEVMYNTEGDLDLRCMSWITEPEIMRVVASADDPAAQDVEFRPINKHVDSQQVFEFLRTQLRECSETHSPQTCPLPSADFVPRRLISIEGEVDDLFVRLYAPKDGESIQWCALSYCWGGIDQIDRTTSANLEDRFHGMRAATLPATLRDGVLVAFRLGLRYIWIDSVCIVQDDVKEVAQDISQMAEIYSNALFTISAARSEKASDGFLHDLEIPPSMVPISLRYTCRSGIEGNLIITNEATPNDLPDPINSRAWTFQERVLSPRLVEFSSTQVRWRCNASVKCESGCQPKTAWKTWFEAATIVNKHTTDQVRGPERTRTWHSLVTSYSKRDLSFSEDKLIAFSAVAKSIGFTGRYLAGLWESELPCNLLWKVYHVWFPIAGDIDKRKPRPSGYRAPSWSWASVDGEVRYDMTDLDMSGPEPACEILDYQVELSNQYLPFGPVSKGHIIIRGQMRPAVFVSTTGEMYFEAPAQGESTTAKPTVGFKGFADTKDDGELGPSNPVAFLVWCLHIRNFGGRGEGLLLVEDTENETFRRVGHFYWSVSELGVDFQHSEQRFVRIV